MDRPRRQKRRFGRRRRFRDRLEVWSLGPTGAGTRGKTRTIEGSGRGGIQSLGARYISSSSEVLSSPQRMSTMVRPSGPRSAAAPVIRARTRSNRIGTSSSLAAAKSNWIWFGKSARTPGASASTRAALGQTVGAFMTLPSAGLAGIPPRSAVLSALFQRVTGAGWPICARRRASWACALAAFRRRPGGPTGARAAASSPSPSA